MEQSARLGDHLFIINGDDGDLEDGVGEIGVPGKAGDVSPNVLVGHHVLVDVVPAGGGRPTAR